MGLHDGAAMPSACGAIEALARRAFRAAADAPGRDPSDAAALARMAGAAQPLTATALLYSLGGVLAPHVDASPTRRKWLAVLSFGCTARFVVGDAHRPLALRSGDALVFDAARVLHGIERIETETAPPELVASSLREARVSIMVWEALPARDRVDDDEAGDDGDVDGTAMLFGDDDESEVDDDSTAELGQ